MTQTIDVKNIRRRKVREARRASGVSSPTAQNDGAPGLGAANPSMADRFEQIAIDKIVESKTNPRRRFNAIDELAGSIREHGVLEPLIVRPQPGLSTGHGDAGRFEIVAGARRFRALKKAGLTTVGCIVRNYTDQQAIEAQVIENNQREDVHPLEEAAGFASLIALGQDVTSIADKIGRPRAYVLKRLQLRRLIKPVHKLLESDELPLGHAMEISRLPEPVQERIAKWMGDCLRGWSKSLPDLRELRRQVANDALRDLAHAKWDRTDALLVVSAGSCETCPKNTANQRDLFDDVDAGKPHCTDPECFEAKRTAFVKLSINKLTAAGEKPILLADSYGDRKKLEKTYGEKVAFVYEFNTIPTSQAKKLNGKVKKAVLLDGEDAGKIVLVPTEHAERSSESDDRTRRWKAEQNRKKEKARQETTINLRVLDACCASPALDLSAPMLRHLVPAWFERLNNDDQRRLCARHGWERTRKDGWNWEHRACRALCAKATPTELAALAVEIGLIASVTVNPYTNGTAERAKRLEATAEVLGVDVGRIRKQFLAEQKKQTPKGKKK